MILNHLIFKLFYFLKSPSLIFLSNFFISCLLFFISLNEIISLLECLILIIVFIFEFLEVFQNKRIWFDVVTSLFIFLIATTQFFQFLLKFWVLTFFGAILYWFCCWNKFVIFFIQKKSFTAWWLFTTSCGASIVFICCSDTF